MVGTKFSPWKLNLRNVSPLPPYPIVWPLENFKNFSSFHSVLSIKVYSVAFVHSSIRNLTLRIFPHSFTFFPSDFGLREGRLTVLRDWGFSSGHTVEELCDRSLINLLLFKVKHSSGSNDSEIDLWFSYQHVINSVGFNTKMLNPGTYALLH